MNKHFELTDETIDIDGRTLHRIRATRDLPHCGVVAGDLGGFVEHLDNLSDAAWVADEAVVYDDASVTDDARVTGNAGVSGNAWVSVEAEVSGSARVSGNAQVFDNAEVTDSARVKGNAWVGDEARVFGDVWVSGDARVFWGARVNNDKHIMIGTLYTSQRFDWTLHRTTDGHVLHIGCYSGTLDDHQNICNSDTWVETTDPEIIREARPEYQNIIDLCRARVARWNN